MPESAPAAVEPRLVRWLAAALGGVAALALFALMAITCVDVAGRYLFNHPLPGATELTEIGVAVVVFALLPVVSWRGAHIVVDLFDHLLPARVRRWRGAAVHLVSAVALAGLGTRIFPLAARALQYGEVTETYAIPSGWIIYGIGVMCWVTAVLLATVGVYRAWRGADQ